MVVAFFQELFIFLIFESSLSSPFLRTISCLLIYKGLIYIDYISFNLFVIYFFLFLYFNSFGLHFLMQGAFYFCEYLEIMHFIKTYSFLQIPN